jgi:hypothetical protein
MAARTALAVIGEGPLFSTTVIDRWLASRM